MPYTVLDAERYQLLTLRRRQRAKRLENSGGSILVDHTCNISYIPDGSIIKASMSPTSNIWEINLPRDFDKSVKKVAKRLDAIAYL